MSSKDKKTPPGDDGTSVPKSPKKPARTLDLEAEEVVPGDEEEKEAKSAESDTAANGEASESEEKLGTNDQREDEDAGADETGATDTGKPPPPPQRTRPSDVRSFVTHLAAGLVGGLIGVVGAGIGLDKLPIPGFSASDSTPAKTAQYEERLLEINTALEEQAKSLANRPAIADLDALKKRLDEIEAKPAPEASLPVEVGDRIGKLEAALKSIETSGPSEGGGNNEQSAAFILRLDKLETALETRATQLEEQIEQTRSSVTKASKTQAGQADPAVMEALEKRLESLEGKLTQIANRPAATNDAAASPSNAGAATALAFQALRRAAETGKPFKTHLDALEKHAGEGTKTTALSQFATNGVPSRTELLNQLPAALKAARTVASKSDDETILGRLASNAQSIVRIRKVGPASGNGAQAILSRVDAAASAGDLEAAIAEAGQLDGAVSGAIAPWLEKAKARKALDVAVTELETQLMSVLGAAGSGPG